MIRHQSHGQLLLESFEVNILSSLNKKTSKRQYSWKTKRTGGR